MVMWFFPFKKIKPFFLFYSLLTLLTPKGREAKCANLLAENDIITPEGMKANLSYTLITQREPDNQVLIAILIIIYIVFNE